MGRKQNYRVRVGQTYWFEYHCLEAAHSQDADLWYRSHQRVKVLKMEEPGIGKDEYERIVVQGAPAAFIVKFKDGSTGTAMEDELLDSPEDYTRPDPPPKPSVESLVNHETSKLIVDALLGDQGVEGFMDTFQKPYTPMLKIFGHPKENFADDLWDKYLTDPKRLSKVHLKVQVIHQKPIEHGVHGQYTQEEKTFVHFDVSEPPWASWTGHLCKAREGMEGYGVFVRLPKFIKRLKRNWPKTGEEMHNQIKLFLREIARPGDYDDVKP